MNKLEEPILKILEEWTCNGFGFPEIIIGEGPYYKITQGDVYIKAFSAYIQMYKDEGIYNVVKELCPDSYNTLLKTIVMFMEDRLGCSIREYIEDRMNENLL